MLYINFKTTWLQLLIMYYNKFGALLDKAVPGAAFEGAMLLFSDSTHVY